MQVALLPQASVAIHVRVSEYPAMHPPLIVASAYVTTGDGSHASEPVANPVLAGNVLAVQVIVTLAGQVMAGAVLSTIKTI
jgi:hypothetical protein